MRLEVKLAFLVLLGISTVSTTDKEEFLTSFQTFNQKLFTEIVKSKGEENIIFSPISVQTALTMVRLGADGETAAEMNQGLGYTGQNPETLADNYFNFLAKYEKSDVLTFANKVYVMKGCELQDHYKELLSKKFFASADNVDFAQSSEAAKTINSWVETKTNNKITDLVSPASFDGDTRLVLLNAVYFNGKWEDAFMKEKTAEKDFFINESDSVKVPMMYRKGACDIYYSDALDSRVLRLPYKDSDLAMLIILPRTRSGLVDLQEKLKNFSYKALGAKRAMPKCQIRMPKFKTEFDIELRSTLMKMGMDQIFGGNGDFSKMIKNSGPFKVSQVFHKAVIEVTEEGTEAAASTGAVMSGRSGPYPFIIDHPFVYTIINEDDVPIFQGVFVRP